MMRSKYGEYPEYHTSLDNLSFVSQNGLYGGFIVYKNAIQCLELNAIPVTKVICEPKLSKRGLYPSVSIKGGAFDSQILLDIYSYSDGKFDFLEIAEKINKPLWLIKDEITKLIDNKIIEILN
jgi:aminopeptidase-like protein